MLRFFSFLRLLRSAHHMISLLLPYTQQVGEYATVLEMLPRTKLGQTTQEQLFLGMNKLGYFAVDPRLRGDKQVMEKTYVCLRVCLRVWC